MKYHFRVYPEKQGFWAECCELKGCRTEAETMEQLQKSCSEVLNLYLEEPKDSKIVFTLPNTALDSDSNLLQSVVEPEVALAVLLRHHRADSKMTQKQVSELLGMKNVYSYQRLERKSNPTLTILNKLTTVFPEIKLDYIFQ